MDIESNWFSVRGLLNPMQFLLLTDHSLLTQFPQTCAIFWHERGGGGGGGRLVTPCETIRGGGGITPWVPPSSIISLLLVLPTRFSFRVPLLTSWKELPLWNSTEIMAHIPSSFLVWEISRTHIFSNIRIIYCTAMSLISENYSFFGKDKKLWKKAMLLLLLKKALDFIFLLSPLFFLAVVTYCSFQFLKGLPSPPPLSPFSKIWNASLSHARFPNQWGEGGPVFISKFNSKSSRFFTGDLRAQKSKGEKPKMGRVCPPFLTHHKSGARP